MLTTLDLRPHALDVLRARYPLKDATGHVIESPEALFRRVAHHVATVEKAYGRDPAAVEDPFFQMMAELEFLGTISIIAGCSTEIEPMYAIAYERHPGRPYTDRSPPGVRAPGEACPECGAPLRFAESTAHCRACG